MSYGKRYYAPFHIALAHAARVDHRVFQERGSFGRHPVFEQL